MGRTFSIATMLLVMAIVAVGAASLRGLWQRVEGGVNDAVLVPVVGGAVAGAVYAFILSVWTSRDPIYEPLAWPRFVLCTICGWFLGTAAGAQMTATVDGAVLALTPLVVIGSAAVVAFNQRRQARLTADRAAHAANESRPTGDDAPAESVAQA
ncbi:MAG: hypothetical protein AB7O59_01380 [Pirellulales bacterium]